MAHPKSTDDYASSVKAKNLLLPGYNKKTKRAWHCKFFLFKLFNFSFEEINSKKLI